MHTEIGKQTDWDTSVELHKYVNITSIFLFIT